VLLASHDLAEIESFASHIAYLEEGRLQFVEEMGALSQRFREIEVTLETAMDLPREWPDRWLNLEQSSVVIRFIDSRFDAQGSEADVRRLFSGVLNITARSMSLRSICVALAKKAKKEKSVR